MMSGHGANPIFFNKKIKIGHPEHSLTPHTPTSNNISFLPPPPHPPLPPRNTSPQSVRRMCTTLYLNAFQYSAEIMTECWAA